MDTIPTRLLEALTALQPDGDASSKVAKVVEEALVRRLHHYQYIDRRLQQKHGMTFTEFRDRHIVGKREYAFEVESDFWEWELAQDGGRTMQRRLTELRRSTG